LNFASSLGNVLLSIQGSYPIYVYPGNTLVVARTSNPVTMDPCDSWDSISNNMLDQVLETLLAYDHSDPELPLVGRLAESWYWSNNLTLTIKLQENVFFHDGSKFTADCVLHTFERINYFGNWSGKLPTSKRMAFPHSLYKFRDGTPILNHTLSFFTDDYNVTLVLNRPFGPIEGLLSYTASSIVHPDSTLVDRMLELSKDLVVGTGPFKLVKYFPNSEVRFERWERYWRTGAYFDGIVYVYYRDGVTANNAMLAGDIDFLGQGIASLKPDFEADPDITVTGNGTSDFITGDLYWYIGFNSKLINITWRKSIIHAFNYTHLIKDIKDDAVVKANSLVPPGFPAHNSSVVGGTYNIPYARQLMQSMGFGYTSGVPWDIGSQAGDVFTPGANETDWTGASFVPDTENFPENAIKFRHKIGSHFMELFFQRFSEDMDLIGINIYIPIIWDPPFIEMGEYDPETWHIWFSGWGPDYFETFSMIDPLVNPTSSSNFAQINNGEINTLLAKTNAETTTMQRYSYYEKLQSLVIDKYFYHMPLFYDKIYFVHAASLKGFPYDVMQDLYWYPTYRDY
jgi:ABC-type transport system substrate-binding protein